MIVKKHILFGLRKLDRKYDESLSSADPMEPVGYAKLALLDYCGWIEDSMDIIVIRAVKGKLRTKRYRKILEEEIVGRNYGFSYDKHFRRMLTQTVGLRVTESLEGFLDKNGMYQPLVTELKAVKKDRDDAAHTSIAGTTKMYPAPSATIGRLSKIYPILKSIYSRACRM